MPHKILEQLLQIGLDLSPITGIEIWMEACKQKVMINGTLYGYSNQPSTKDSWCTIKTSTLYPSNLS